MPEKQHSQRLGTEAIVPLIFRLSIPSIIAMSVQSLYNVVDSIYIGRVSKEALSALTLAFPVQIILIGISVGTGIGASSLIARLLGRNEKAKAHLVAELAIAISIVSGIIVAILGIFASPYILRLFNDDPVLIGMGTEYIRIIMIGSVTLFFTMISNNILRGQGNTFFPMVTMVIGAVLNIILDPFFIFGIGFFPRWEIAGAAVATVLSRFISGIFMVYLLLSKHNELKPTFRNFRVDLQLIKEIYQVGFPAMIMQLLASLMVGGMNRILGSFSVSAIAVGGIFFRLQSFVFLPIIGLVQGYMPIVGYNFGQRSYKRMRQAIRSTALMAFSFSTLGLLIFQLFPRQLVTLFNDEPELVKIGVTALRTVSIGFPFIGPAVVAESTFQALGYGLPSLALSTLRQVVFLIPLLYILGHFLGLNALWFAFPISELFNGIIAAIWISTTLRRIFQSVPLKQL